MTVFPAPVGEMQARYQRNGIAAWVKAAQAATGYRQTGVAAAVFAALVFAGKGAIRIPMAITSRAAVMANSRPCFKTDRLPLLCHLQFEAHISIGRNRCT